MDTILYILAILLIISSFVGCFLPVLPGPPLAFLALLCVHFTKYFEFGTTGLVVLGVIAVGITILDNFMSVIGTKLGGGTRWGFWGSIIGTIVALFFLSFWGIIIGPFIGAFLGELLGGNGGRLAFRSALASFLGFITGIVFKLTYCLAVIIFFIIGIF
jgi:uncharacterized protein